MLLHWFKGAAVDVSHSLLCLCAKWQCWLYWVPKHCSQRMHFSYTSTVLLNSWPFFYFRLSLRGALWTVTHFQGILKQMEFSYHKDLITNKTLARPLVKLVKFYKDERFLDLFIFQNFTKITFSPPYSPLGSIENVCRILVFLCPNSNYPFWVTLLMQGCGGAGEHKEGIKRFWVLGANNQAL